MPTKPKVSAKIAAIKANRNRGIFLPPLPETREEIRQPTYTPILMMIMAVRVCGSLKPRSLISLMVQVVMRKVAGEVVIKSRMRSRVRLM